MRNVASGLASSAKSREYLGERVCCKQILVGGSCREHSDHSECMKDSIIILIYAYRSYRDYLSYS